jgi:HlyD family secretion protein
MDVTITVEAYPNRPFRGRVLKVEPQATVNQNVTMFPVLVRIANDGDLLKPGMNAEVEVHIGERRGVISVANSALRTDQDVASAAQVLGLATDAVFQEIADARRLAAEQQGGEASMGNRSAPDGSTRETITGMGGREIPLPEGVSREQAQAVFAKVRSGGFESLSAEDRALLQKLRPSGGGGLGARSGQRSASPSAALFGGNYIVFAMREGKPVPVPVRTGLTDLDYSEVVSGLQEGDSVLVLPSASLIASPQEMQDRMNRMGRGGIPGVQRQTTNSSSTARPSGPPGGGPPGR